MVSLIVSRTNRIDKTDVIRSSVRKAIRMVHTAGYFPRDIVEESVDLGGTYSDFKVALPPRVRKFTIVAPMSATGNPLQLTTRDNTYDYVSASDLIDSYFERKSDIYYVAGEAIVVKGTVGASSLYVSYYCYPEVQDNNLETWLMKDNDSVFIDAALSDFYPTIGRMELAREARTQMMLQLQGIIEDFTSMEE